MLTFSGLFDLVWHPAPRTPRVVRSGERGRQDPLPCMYPIGYPLLLVVVEVSSLLRPSLVSPQSKLWSLSVYHWSFLDSIKDGGGGGRRY